MEEQKKNISSNVLVSSRFIFGLLGTLFISLSVGWFAFWNGCEFHDYKWIWSENNLVLSGQYLLNVLWGIAFVTSPVWWMGGNDIKCKNVTAKNIMAANGLRICAVRKNETLN